MYHVVIASTIFGLGETLVSKFGNFIFLGVWYSK
jgi:hypothetical protein